MSLPYETATAGDKALVELQRVLAAATPAPWSHHEPGCCRAIMYENGVICQMMNDQVDMQDATGHAPTKEQAQINMQLVCALRNAAPALIAAAALLIESRKWQALGEFGDPLGPECWTPEYRDYMTRLDAAIAALGENDERH